MGIGSEFGFLATLVGAATGLYCIGASICIPFVIVVGGGYMYFSRQPITGIIEVYDETEFRAMWTKKDQKLRINLAYGGSEPLEDLFTLLEKRSLMKIVNEHEQHFENLENKTFLGGGSGRGSEKSKQKADEITELDVRHIRFTQDTVGANFRNGESVLVTANGIKDGSITKEDIPPIKVFKYEGKTYSLDNRRLLAARIAAFNGGRTKIRVCIIRWEMARYSLWKLTHPQHGREIKIKDAGTATPSHCKDDWLQDIPNETIRQIRESLLELLPKRKIPVRKRSER